MAKLDTYSGPSRRPQKGARQGTALADDEMDGEFLRPPVLSRPAGPRRAAASFDDFREPETNAAGDDAPFLRTRKRVPVRKGLLPRGRLARIGLVAGGFAAAGLAVAGAMLLRSFFEHDARFRIESAALVQTVGNSQLTRAELLSVFGSDIGRNIFFVPLKERRAALEQVSWVEHGTVMRLLPNQLRVAIVERTPIAFARVGSRVELVDAHGVLLTMAPAALAARHYSFPVVTGINPEDPLSVREPRMRIYQRFVQALDADTAAGTKGKVSQQLSEVDLSDPEDVRALVPAQGSDLLLHFGDDDFLDRWHNYQAHIAEWRQQYPKLASVDLRYNDQVVLKMADGAPAGPVAPARDTSAQGSTTPLPVARPAPAPKRPAAVRHGSTQARHPVAHAARRRA